MLRESASATAAAGVRGSALDRLRNAGIARQCWWTALPPRAYCCWSTTGPSTSTRWGSKTYYTQLRIDPLTGGSAEELLRTLLGDDPSLMPLKQLLIERTEGNPLFLEESVRALVETGALQAQPRSYCLNVSLDRSKCRPRYRPILAARIDRLRPRTNDCCKPPR